jgi:urease accessory protein
VWLARLNLNYEFLNPKTVVRDSHEGPLRILKSLYPEDPKICHNVLVHPPSGLVGGDQLKIELDVGEHSHALITTPGATRFYGSEGVLATQSLSARVKNHARLEWLPLESIAYNSTCALNQMCFTLEPQAQMLAWDVTQLGLPSANKPFQEGVFSQHFEIHNTWLDKANIQATDTRLLESKLGLAGKKCMGTLVMAQGSPFDLSLIARQIELTQSALTSLNKELLAGVTSPNPKVIVLRVLSLDVETSLNLLKKIWKIWRASWWNLSTNEPRIWAS